MTVRFADESEDPEAATSSHDPHEVNEITPLYVQVSFAHSHSIRSSPMPLLPFYEETVHDASKTPLSETKK